MKDIYIPERYELCSRFSLDELGDMAVELASPKDWHYIKNAKSFRVIKKYTDRLLRRTEAYLQFVKKEARKRKSFDFLYDNNIYKIYKKNRFVGFRIGAGQNKSAESSA